MPGSYQISIVIPTRNRAESLNQCVLSLLNQTLPPKDYEVIVIDDDSTDKTAETIKQLGLPKSFRYNRQSHAGSGAARNHGASLAQSDIILFFDDDVVASPHLLETHVKAHEKRGCTSILGYTPFANDLIETPIISYHRSRWENIFQEAASQQEVKGKITFNYFITLNLSVRRNDFTAIGPFDLAFNAAYEDTELGLRFAQANIPLYFCREALAWHRPILTEKSLTERQEGFGYRAGNYYLAHPESTVMNTCMNVDHILGYSATERPVTARIREKLRHLVMHDYTARSLLLLATKTPPSIISPHLRNYFFRLVSNYHYGKGFKQALVQHNHH